MLNWTFDTVAACLIIYRLLKRELNNVEIDRASESANFAIWLKDWFFSGWYINPDRGRLQRLLKGMRIPSSEKFISLLFLGRQIFWEKVHLYGWSQKELLKFIPTVAEGYTQKANRKRWLSIGRRVRYNPDEGQRRH